MAQIDIPDDILDNVFRSNATAGGLYLDRYGKYKLMILYQMYKAIKDVGRCFITKVEVVESAPLEVDEPATTKSEARRVVEEPHPVGYRPSYTINWDGEAGQSADGNAKALVLAEAGLPEMKVTEQQFKATFRECVNEKQMGCGLLIGCEIRPKGAGKKEGGGTFTHIIKLPFWQSLGAPGQGENDWESLKARRAQVEQFVSAEMARDAERDRQAAAGGGSGGSFLPAGGAPVLPGAGAPSIPGAAPDPLAGWQLHAGNAPGDPDPYYWKGSDVKRRSQIVPATSPAVPVVAAGANGHAAAAPPPSIPAAGAPALPVAADPLAGWQLHAGNAPGDPDPYYWQGSTVKRRSEIVAGR